MDPIADELAVGFGGSVQVQPKPLQALQLVEHGKKQMMVAKMWPALHKTSVEAVQSLLHDSELAMQSDVWDVASSFSSFSPIWIHFLTELNPRLRARGSAQDLQPVHLVAATLLEAGPRSAGAAGSVTRSIYFLSSCSSG